MRYALWVIAAMIVYGILATVRDVGKPRKPMTGGTAALVVVVSGAMAVVLVLAGMRLS